MRLGTVLTERIGNTLVAFKPTVSQIKRVQVQLPHSRRLGSRVGQRLSDSGVGWWSLKKVFGQRAESSPADGFLAHGHGRVVS